MITNSAFGRPNAIRHLLIAETAGTLSLFDRLRAQDTRCLPQNECGSRCQVRLSTRAVGYLVRRALEKAGLAAKAISPHSLRHTYAIRALRAGGNVIAVQKLLGHASVATTQRYLDHLALGELRAAVPPLPMSAG
jgi:site-specific recombinase XerD